MRNTLRLTAILVLIFGVPAMGAAPKSPLETYAANIAQENRHYSQVPHAMLKIQDVVYLGEGNQAVLTGKKGEPGSWRWSKKLNAPGPLRVAFRNDRLIATLDGRSLDSAVISKGVPLDVNIDVAGEPTQVGAAVNGWRIFIFNQKTPAAVHFTGVSYYPFNPEFRVEARFSPDPRLRPRIFLTSRGTKKQFYHAGDAAFAVRGTRINLPLYAESNDPKQIKSMTSFFTDGLTGRGAYGAGRYVDVTDFDKFPPAKVNIDFNLAYNPNCARSPYFTCPVAVDNIPIDVTAGERDPHQSQ